MANLKNPCIAYFAVHLRKGNGGYVGGMLVIDETGVPQEFRCTLPTLPTTAQKALYGNTLEPFISNQLIGAPLAKSLTTRPECLVVKSPTLLKLREHTELPVIHLEKYGETLSADVHSYPNEEHRLESMIGGFQPITASRHPDYQSDYESVRATLERVFKRTDLLEPFERIAAAMSVLSERDDRFK